MYNQTAPPYSATEPASTQPMQYVNEKETPVTNTTQQPTAPIQHGNHDFIEQVAVQPDHASSAQHDPDVYERGPEPAYVTPLHQLSETPAMIACLHCEHRAMTRVDKSDSSMTTLVGVLLCLVCVCAACLPCMCGWFQDIDHYCTNCNKKVVHRGHDGGNEIVYPVKVTPENGYQEVTNFPLAKPQPVAKKG